MDADPLGTWAQSMLVSERNQIDEEKSSRSYKWNINMDVGEKEDLNELARMEKLQFIVKGDQVAHEF